ncbi:thiol peroxidase [Candidatus Manganitrophus noduliformans]|uniref:Thiol peroxidase n=1 Tax=Candidatus Manganitrophus noduliformans TaxID=2606439 RepID=A0A7X6DPL7_9BACT|nr:thiol peroxidase [Candidatus Manganitrophus noduliformans]NKE71010.1 thiol peroxidase [Candidatus Manganitrophus noduliformans]
MKKIWIALILLSVVGCSAVRSQTMPIAKESASAGEGQSVTFKGKALALEGTGIKVGDRLPAAVLAANDLSPVNLAETGGKVRIISVVPSLDTPVCEEQTHALSERNGGLDKEVQLITVSMDLPFAQKRFSKEAKIGNVLFLSDYKGAEFGRSYGLLIQPLHLLSRAVLVVDKENVVRHLQVVPEITELPDLEAAMQAAKGLL